ncbi:hypothetical protein L218DRAFT_1022744 [Marasmius fiardii PR-910]|nr:hypothetical protein L218DRAFT_1022744 [Marasmius fiardii PR-910]
MENILALGVILGPKKPKDIDSFLWPLVRELLRPRIGVTTYNALSRSMFVLRADLILVFGDILAMSMVMRIVGHNRFSPCHMCKITGL